MSKKIVCPLRFNSTNNECIPNCAWYVGSDLEPMCAVKKISFCLTSIDENNGGIIFDSSNTDE